MCPLWGQAEVREMKSTGPEGRNSQAQGRGTGPHNQLLVLGGVRQLCESEGRIDCVGFCFFPSLDMAAKDSNIVVDSGDAPTTGAFNVNPSIIFAQKASAVVRAAGFDPQSLDIELFRKYAADIFYSAIQGIYKEKLSLDHINDEISERELLKLKCQLCIDKLLEKTNNPLLRAVTAEDIADGNHKGIGILVSIVFSEGQKLWLEKKAKQQGLIGQTDNEGNAHNLSPSIDRGNNNNTGEVGNQETIRPMSAPLRPSSGRKKRPASAGSSRLDQSNSDAAKRATRVTMTSPDAARKRASSSQDGQPISPASQSSSGASPRHSLKPTMKLMVMEGLVDRIKELETEIEAISSEDRDTTKLLKEFDEFVRGKRDQTQDNNPINVYTKPVASLLSPRARAFTIIDGNTRATGDDNGEGGEGARAKKQTTRAKRPSSAPSKRSKVRQQNAVFQRLYNEGQEMREKLLEQQLQQQQQDAIVNNNNNNTKRMTSADYFDSDYTYDMVSGRRILRSQAEKMEEQRKRAKEMQGNILYDLDHNTKHDATMADGNKPSSNKANVVLSQRFEKSMDQYVQKQRLEREQREHYTKPVPKDFTTAKCFGAYRGLEPLDLVISVEHCHDCENHSITTWHDADEYVNVAHHTLKHLAEYVHSQCLCVRLGVVRFQAKIGTHVCHPVNAHSPLAEPKQAAQIAPVVDADSRIGALEVQIAYRNKHGQVLFDLLHSKLATTRWPSKSVIERRLQAFVSKAKIPTFSLPEDGDCEYAGYASCGAAGGSGSGSGSEEGLIDYPVGVGPWAATALASRGWFLPIVAKKLRLVAEASSQKNKQPSTSSKPQTPRDTKQVSGKDSKNAQSPAEPENEDDVDNRATLVVQWVYDSRGSVVPLPISVGSTVCVFDVETYYQDGATAKSNQLSTAEEALQLLSHQKEVNYLLGTVKGPVHSTNNKSGNRSARNADGEISEFVVRLKYFKTDYVVKTVDCVKLSDLQDYSSRENKVRDVSIKEEYSVDIVPAELQALMLLWQDLNQEQSLQAELQQLQKQLVLDTPGLQTCAVDASSELLSVSRPMPAWRAMENTDAVDEASHTLLLCRSSMFHHFRHVAAWIEQSLALLSGRYGSGGKASISGATSRLTTVLTPDAANGPTVLHPLTGESVCLQDCYTEQMLNWLEARCGTEHRRAAVVDCSVLLNAVLMSVRSSPVCDAVLLLCLQQCGQHTPGPAVGAGGSANVTGTNSTVVSGAKMLPAALLLNGKIPYYAAIPAAAPNFRKLTKAEVMTVALNGVIFMLRNRVVLVCVQFCAMRRLNIFGAHNSAATLSSSVERPVDTTVALAAMDASLLLLLRLAGCSDDDGDSSTSVTINCHQLQKLVLLLGMNAAVAGAHGSSNTGIAGHHVDDLTQSTKKLWRAISKL
jgi:hypothetical protein